MQGQHLPLEPGSLRRTYIDSSSCPETHRCSGSSSCDRQLRGGMLRDLPHKLGQRRHWGWASGLGAWGPAVLSQLCEGAFIQHLHARDPGLCPGERAAVQTGQESGSGRWAQEQGLRGSHSLPWRDWHEEGTNLLGG